MAGQAIYTVGYGNREVAALIELLIQHKIDVVIDIRSAPYSSYKPEFSKDPLRLALNDRGIAYSFFGTSLGGRPDDENCLVNGKVDYELLAASDNFRDGLVRLLEFTSTMSRPCLLCSEGRPEECHRSKLVGVVLAKRGVDVQHIDEEGKLISQYEVIKKLTGGQTSLFEEHYTSKRKYQTKTG